MKAYGPGLERTGCIVNNPAEFTVETGKQDAGKAPLKMYAQVKSQRQLCETSAKGLNTVEKNALSISTCLHTT